MKSGYKIYWTPNALDELKKIFNYLEKEFTYKELNNLASEIERTLLLISQNPFLFQKSEYKDCYKVIILKYNTMYYRINSNTIEILSFFSNRQNPKTKL